MSKTIKTRIAQKHDYELNWVLAGGFYPMSGEIIIYDAETPEIVEDCIANLESKGIDVADLLSQLGRTADPIPYQRVKIGNGVDLVRDLPFVVDQGKVEEILLDYAKIVDAAIEAVKEEYVPKSTNWNDSMIANIQPNATQDEARLLVQVGDVHSWKGPIVVKALTTKDEVNTHRELTIKSDDVAIAAQVSINGDMHSTGSTVFGEGNIVTLEGAHVNGNNNTVRIFALPDARNVTDAQVSTYLFNPIEHDENGIISRCELTFDIKEDLNEVLSTTISSSATEEHLVNWVDDVGYVWITFVYGNEKLRKQVAVTHAGDKYVLDRIELSIDDTSSELLEKLEVPTNSVLVLIQGGLIGEEVDASEFGFASFAAGSGNAIGLGSSVLGSMNRAVGYVSYAEGHNTEALGEYSHAQNWTTSAIGVASTAMGGRTVAIGQYSTAVGQLNVAKGDKSLATGTNTKAIGTSSTSMGGNTQAIGTNSLATGYSTEASGVASFSAGNSTKAVGDNSAAFGAGNIVNGSSSFVAGASSLVEKPYSFVFGHASASLDEGAMVLGRECRAGGTATYSGGVWSNIVTGSGKQSFAGGLKSTASGAQAFAFGNNAIVTGQCGVAFGKDTEAAKYGFASGYGSKSYYDGGVAIGDSCSTNSQYSVALGSNSVIGTEAAYSLAVGRSTNVTGYCGVAMGHSATSAGNYAVAIGHGSQANAECAVSIGHANTVAATLATAVGASNNVVSEATAAFVFGEKNTANSKHSLAGGASSESLGTYSFAFGRHSVAKGIGSIAIGTANPANSATDISADTEVHEAGADYSVVLGRGCKTTSGATCAIALGAFNTIESAGKYALTAGRNNMISHEYTMVAGQGLKTSANNQAVFGKFNAIDSDTVFAIGTGTSDSNRKDAFKVTKDGRAFANGKEVLTQDQITFATADDISALFA